MIGLTVMRRIIGALALGVAMWASSPAVAGMLNQDAQNSAASTCQVAEINPVTGHTECIKPLGAAVEAPPPLVGPCQAGPHSTEPWSYQPDCK